MKYMQVNVNSAKLAINNWTPVMKQEFLEFFKQQSVQEALDKNDFDTLYQLFQQTDYIECGLTTILIAGEVDFISNMNTLYSNMFFEILSISELTIPKNITMIQAHAFDTCPLKELSYEGTKEEFHPIHKSLWTWKDSNVRVIHCVDGDIEITREQRGY